MYNCKSHDSSQSSDKCDKCDKSFSDANRPIICESCTTIHCENCWITDEDYHFCPWCFKIPLENKRIIYYPGNCYVCLESTNDFVVMSCGHSMCRKDYSTTLHDQKKMEWFDGFHLTTEEDRYSRTKLINKCGVCRITPNRCVQAPFRNVYKNITNVTKRISMWNLYPLYKYIVRQNTFPPQFIRKLMQEYVQNL